MTARWLPTLFLTLSTLPGLAQTPVYVPYTAAQAQTEKRLWDDPVWKTAYRPTLSEEEKVAGLSRFWAEAKYNFAFFDKVPKLSWDSLYLATIPKVKAAPTTLAYYQVLQEMCAQLHDGHTNVYEPYDPKENQNERPPLRTALIEDKVLITEVRSATLRRQGLVPGVEVVAIDGVPARQYGQSRAAGQSASTPQDRDVRTYTYTLLSGKADQPLALTLQDAKGHTFKQTVARSGYSDVEKGRLPAMRFRLLPGNVAYVALNAFDNDSLPKLFAAAYPQISQASALLLDVRNNGGGSSELGYDVLSYLTDKAFLTSRWMTRDYHPAFRAWQRDPRWYSEPVNSFDPKGTAPYTRPVLVLTSARSFSAAEDFAVAFDQMKRGKIVGEPTGGSTGQPLFFTLPGGGAARICTKRDSYADGKDFVGVGVQPQVLVRPTVRDTRAGRDTVLEAALKELKGRPKS
ncbi:S41 family peptidase [Hymenobacter sp. BRD67]|uniref:S41 family peptidase n=1 Tax=Hymenobacter sp. BRD67 TaxID=2675877 RepID=UPI001566967C|nr:S41 family peptidase [Hymenobacter sp. BRD67]QKG51254.1 S41 family peptidase [Hymenobacter sp. BRD67]